MNGSETIDMESKPKSPDYANILAEIESIMGDEEKEKSFIEGRLETLTSQTEQTQISLASQSLYDKFIHPQTDIKRNYIYDGIKIDDNSVYQDLLKNAQAMKNTTWQSRTMREIMPSAVLHTIDKYFGNVTATDQTEQQNQRMYMDHTTTGSEAMSIEEFKGKRLAVCTEKAALSQNLLKFVGLDSSLVMSKSSRLSSGKEEAHAYNIVETEKGGFIFDPTNPELTFGQNGQIENYSPNFYPLSLEQFQSLTNGGEVQIEHKDYQTGSEDQREVIVSTRIYGGAKQ